MRSNLDAAPCLTPIADDSHRTAAGDFTIRKGECTSIVMKVRCQNCTHYRVCGRAKQAFELRRSGCRDLSAETNAGSVQEPVFIGFGDIDCYFVSFNT